ncbi:MAG TPA: iron export ABC transporter permease subunit FetB [Bacillota bacterium]
MNYIPITDLDLLVAVSLIGVTLGISIRERLGLERDLLIGAVRGFIQLMLVGYVLQYIFDLRRWYLVILILAIMILVAGSNALKRQKLRWRRLFWILTAAIAGGSVLVLAVVIGFILKVRPWYLPQYMIPLAGMIIGNSMVGAALAANRLSADIKDGRPRIELALALGATSRQAVAPYLREALKAAMLPTISSMMTVGIVQLPGMMTGQIISGTNPGDAVRYQIVVMYMVAAATALTVIVVVLGVYRSFFNSYLQLLDEPR